MKIKKYIGNSVQDAMNKLKEDLGPDAVVLNSRTIKPTGLFKFFKKTKFEITAGYGETKTKTNSNEDNRNIEEIKMELRELKGIMNNLSTLAEKEKNDLPNGIKKYHRILVENGVEQNIAFAILNEVSKGLDIEKLSDLDKIKLIKNKINEIMGDSKPLTITDEQKVVFFVGPTGVGKTTTLAKIAASLVLEDKFDIGLITADTYRVGAVDQLKIYSDILNLPLEIAYNEKDLEQSFINMENKDVILVDTAGRNHNSLSQINDLKRILETSQTKEIYLLISATSDMRVMEALLKRYSFLDDYKIVVTKIDELDNYGSILNIKYIFNKEIVYYTIGQNVPEDIRILDVNKLANRLVKER